MRAAAHYLFAAVVLTVYGVEVCPYLDGLGTGWVGAVTAAALALGLLARVALLPKRVRSAPLAVRPARQFALELGVFIASGAALTVFDTLYFGFPLGSGLKVMVGFAALGLFAALDLALERARDGLAEAQRIGLRATDLERRGSMARRLGLFAGLIAVGVLLGMLLLFLRDVAWMSGSGGVDLAAARRAVTLEVLFVGGVLALELVNLSLSYAGYLQALFESETAVLRRVAEGKLDRYVHLPNRDEFGQIAAYTNLMIDGLEERRRLKEVFGKMVSPDVARRLLSDDSVSPGGRRHEAVVLFSDVRGFTARSEHASPEVLVDDLNRYFARMVEIVHAEGGIVDKFIGDGLMCVFGLDDPTGAEARAVRAALAMQAAVRELSPTLSEPLAIGVGVHRGEVVAGNIGSPERLEFTVIGDTVNTAARLESLTRAVDADVVVSAPVRAALDGDWRVRDLGAHALKGRTAAIEVFAVDPA